MRFASSDLRSLERLRSECWPSFARTWRRIRSRSIRRPKTWKATSWTWCITRGRPRRKLPAPCPAPALPLAKAGDVLVHPGRIDLASLLTGLSALAILVVLARSRLAVVSALIALVIPTVVVVLAGA